MKRVSLIVLLGFIATSCSHFVWTVKDVIGATIVLIIAIVVIITAIIILISHLKDLVVDNLRKLFKKKKS